MAKFYRVGFCSWDLETLNIVRCFRNLLHLSDIAKCDGMTLDEFIMSDYAKFDGPRGPCEEPMPSNFRLWQSTIRRLCSGTNSLLVVMGQYICPPHIACRWFTTVDMGDIPIICQCISVRHYFHSYLVIYRRLPIEVACPPHFNLLVSHLALCCV
jgi:hypothetical protein